MTLTTRVSEALRRWWRRLWPSQPRLVVAVDLWGTMVAELGRRGLDGRREAGAFLLADRGLKQRRVVKVIYLDDLDPECLVGGIHFRAVGYSRLWETCASEGLRVVADVHTHPGRGVAQSGLDRENPMIARSGHLAIIVPDHATRTVSARDVGVHLYRGEQGWKSSFGQDAEGILRIEA